MMQQLATLTARNAELERRIRHQDRAAAAANELAAAPKPRAPALPERFDGTPALLRAFLAQLSLMFRLYPNSYPTDALQVGLVCSLLSGTAADWLATMTQREPLPAMFQDIRLFIEKLAEVFGEHDAQVTADSKIRSLRQTHVNVQEYNVAFRKLALVLGWNSTALVSQYRWGLRDDLKNLLMSIQYPNSLDGIMTSAVLCSNRLIEQSNAARQQPFPNNRGGQRFGAPYVGGGGGQQPRRNFGPEDRMRRGDEVRCQRCNRPGHSTANCRGGGAQVFNGAPNAGPPIGGGNGRPIPAFAGPRRAAIAVIDAEEGNYQDPHLRE
jgi:Domain of unknown function (DUF4939)